MWKGEYSVVRDSGHLETDETGGTQRYKDVTEVKQSVLRLIDEGTTYRDIAKRTFQIGAVRRHFSIATISRWDKERRPEPEQEQRLDKSATDRDQISGELTAKIFKLLNEKATLVEIAIRLRIPAEIVKIVHEQWIMLKRQQWRARGLYVVDPSSMNALLDHAQNTGRRLAVSEMRLAASRSEVWPFEEKDDVEAREVLKILKESWLAITNS